MQAASPAAWKCLLGFRVCVQSVGVNLQQRRFSVAPTGAPRPWQALGPQSLWPPKLCNHLTTSFAGSTQIFHDSQSARPTCLLAPLSPLTLVAQVDQVRDEGGSGGSGSPRAPLCNSTPPAARAAARTRARRSLQRGAPPPVPSPTRRGAEGAGGVACLCAKWGMGVIPRALRVRAGLGSWGPSFQSVMRSKQLYLFPAGL